MVIPLKREVSATVDTLKTKQAMSVFDNGMKLVIGLLKNRKLEDLTLESTNG